MGIPVKRCCLGWMLVFVLSLLPSGYATERGLELDGWTAAAPREEVRPAFRFEADGGRDGQPSLIIEADDREGLDGYWSKTLPVEGERFYRFQAFSAIGERRIAAPQRAGAYRLAR
ncbi:MAG: hypothetical protein KY475_12845 [Planctomycetes bacterium]|nr:hypothetical protein [Planctomycetota bacterium]